MAIAIFIGSDDLKIPEPTKIPSAPSCITREASAGVAIPPAAKVTAGIRFRRTVSSTNLSGTSFSLA